MTTVVIPEGSPLAAEAPKPQKLVKTTANKKPSKPKAAPKPKKAATKRPKAKKVKAGSTSLRGSSVVRHTASSKTSSKPGRRGVRKDGKPRRRPGTNPPSTKENGAYGKKVAAARAKKDWTQKQLAEKVGFSQPGIANIERGVIGASDEAKKKINKALGIAA